MDHKSSKNQITNLALAVDQKISPFFTEKLPPLPENIREILVKIAPYVTMIGVIFGAFAIVALLGLVGVASPMVTMYGSTGATQAYGFGLIGMVFLALQVVLHAIAIPGLLKRERNAWYLLFLGSLVSLIYDLISLNIFNLVISFLITFYLLYQIKPGYNR